MHNGILVGIYPNNFHIEILGGEVPKLISYWNNGRGIPKSISYWNIWMKNTKIKFTLKVGRKKNNIEIFGIKYPNWFYVEKLGVQYPN